MGHRNYSMFSEKKENKEVIETPITEEVGIEVSTQEQIHEVIEEVNHVIEEPTIEQTAEAITEVTGFIDGCDRLYVRKESNVDSEPITIIDRSTSLVIDLENSTEDFYKVKTSEGVEGFCMKKFININI